jgi:hypothetical protein
MFICGTLIIHQFAKNDLVLRTLILGVKYISQEELELPFEIFFSMMNI